MVIIGLLLISLICLVLGLILQNAVWLVASLIATAGAGYLLYRLRDVITVPKQARQVRPRALRKAMAKTASAPNAARVEPAQLGIFDADTDADEEAVGAADAAGAPDAAGTLEAVEADAKAPAEHGLEDAPSAERGPEAESVMEADVDEVWVIDGRPRYHLGDCAIIKGQDAEPIPYEQATEDGFMPCSLCEPHAVSYPPR